MEEQAKTHPLSQTKCDKIGASRRTPYATFSEAQGLPLGSPFVKKREKEEM